MPKSKNEVAKKPVKKAPVAKKPVKAKRKYKKRIIPQLGERGRPVKYNTTLDDLAFRLSLLGHTDEQIAGVIGINTDTLNEWKKRHKTFSVSIKEGKEDADSKVAKSLYHRALGFAHEDTDIKMYEGKIIETKIIKQYPPDATSAIFWLKNRQPKGWRDKQEVEHSGQIDMIEITNYGEKKDE